ncbi:MAG: hypothetical protein GY879_09875 [Planctomycetes bacterium]|nr:hypothetical protein [Planctomycetota bacterium]MCP4859997.1 hypothetical protein [Planctomycetota bacterium]
MLLISTLALAPFAVQNPIDVTMDPNRQPEAGQIITNSSRAAAGCDDFNRADSPSMGPDWIEQTGDIEILGNQGHGLINFSLMTHVPTSGPYIGSTVATDFDHGGGLNYVAVVAGYSSLTSCVFVKIQDNDSDGMYDRVFFYNGNSGGTWGSSTYYYDLATPTVSGSMTLSFDPGGDIAILNVENDASGLTETFTGDNLLAIAGSLGTGYGIGTYGPAFFDNVSINDGCGSGGLNYATTGLVGGSTATLTVSGATAGGGVLIGYSLTGAGPTMTPFGPVDMSAPITQLPVLTADGAGVAALSLGVPGRASGLTVYTQAADLATATLTNSLAEVVL